MAAPWCGLRSGVKASTDAGCTTPAQGVEMVADPPDHRGSDDTYAGVPPWDMYGEKPGGLVVDMLRLADQLADAVATYPPGRKDSKGENSSLRYGL